MKTYTIDEGTQVSIIRDEDGCYACLECGLNVLRAPSVDSERAALDALIDVMRESDMEPGAELLMLVHLVGHRDFYDGLIRRRFT